MSTCTGQIVQWLSEHNQSDDDDDNAHQDDHHECDTERDSDHDELPSKKLRFEDYQTSFHIIGTCFNGGSKRFRQLVKRGIGMFFRSFGLVGP